MNIILYMVENAFNIDIWLCCCSVFCFPKNLWRYFISMQCYFKKCSSMNSSVWTSTVTWLLLLCTVSCWLGLVFAVSLYRTRRNCENTAINLTTTWTSKRIGLWKKKLMSLNLHCHYCKNDLKYILMNISMFTF